MDNSIKESIIRAIAIEALRNIAEHSLEELSADRAKKALEEISETANS